MEEFFGTGSAKSQLSGKSSGMSTHLILSNSIPKSSFKCIASLCIAPTPSLSLSGQRIISCISTSGDQSFFKTQ